MRLFVALNPDPATLAWIASEQARLRSALARFSSEIRWLPPESLHLTLCFLGEIPDSAPAEQALSTCSIEPVHMEWTRAGVFPGTRRPTVLWLGIADSSGALARLQGDVATAMSAFVEPERRKFKPHLTLARINPLPRTSIGAALASHPGPMHSPPWVALGLSLMRSELTPTGAQYSLMREFGQ